MFRSRAAKLTDGSFRPMEDVPSVADFGSAWRQASPARATSAADRRRHGVRERRDPERSAASRSACRGQHRRTVDGKGWELDELLMDERFIAVNVAGKGLVVLTACSHAGVVNVLTHARASFPDVKLHCRAGRPASQRHQRTHHPADRRGAARLRSRRHRRRPLHRLARPDGAQQRIWRQAAGTAGRGKDAAILDQRQTRRERLDSAPGVGDTRPPSPSTGGVRGGPNPAPTHRERSPHPHARRHHERARAQSASPAVPGARAQGPDPVRRAAHRKPPSRQLSRRDPQLRAPAARLRVPVLRGRPARHHRVAGPGSCSASQTREIASAFLAAGVDGQQAHHLQPVDGARARPARLDLQLRGPPRLDEPHDAVQGEGRQGPRERLARPLRLSGADGGRHPDLQGHARAGRRGPEAAPRADARHRHQVQQRLRRAGLLPGHRAADLRRGDARDEPARRHQEDEQVRPVGLLAAST